MGIMLIQNSNTPISIQLLMTLQEVSASFFERTKRVSDNVEGLALEATASHVTLANILTKVSLLAHTKFIESVSFFFII